VKVQTRAWTPNRAKTNSAKAGPKRFGNGIIVA